MMNINDYKNLIKIVQEDNGIMSEIAMNDILADIIEYRMNSQLAKYRNKITAGSMIDFDDIQQIFLIACSEAVYKADVDMGNPMLFILQKGKWAVVDALRSTYRQTITQYCDNCHSHTRLFERNGIPICPKCGAEGHSTVHRDQIINNDDGTVIDQIIAEESLEDQVIEKLFIEDFKKKLSGRKLEIFELIIDEGYDRDSCKNYIKEIAEVLGIGTTNVNLRLRAIKEQLQEYLNE